MLYFCSSLSEYHVHDAVSMIWSKALTSQFVDQFERMADRVRNFPLYYERDPQAQAVTQQEQLRHTLLQMPWHLQRNFLPQLLCQNPNLTRQIRFIFLGPLHHHVKSCVFSEKIYVVKNFSAILEPTLLQVLVLSLCRQVLGLEALELHACACASTIDATACKQLHPEGSSTGSPLIV